MGIYKYTSVADDLNLRQLACVAGAKRGGGRGEGGGRKGKGKGAPALRAYVFA